MNFLNQCFVRDIGFKDNSRFPASRKETIRGGILSYSLCMCVEDGVEATSSLPPLLCWHNRVFNSLHALLRVICRGLEVFPFFLVSMSLKSLAIVLLPCSAVFLSGLSFAFLSYFSYPCPLVFILYFKRFLSAY